MGHFNFWNEDKYPKWKNRICLFYFCLIRHTQACPKLSHRMMLCNLSYVGNSIYTTKAYKAFHSKHDNSFSNRMFFSSTPPILKKKKKVFSLWFIHSFISKMAKYKVVIVMVLTEFADSDDKKLCRRKTRKLVKMRRKSGYFQNIFQKLFQKLFLLVFHMCLKDTPLYRACFFFLLIMLVL